MSEIRDEILEEEVETRDEYAGFVVDNDEKAEWCLERIAEKKRDIEKWKAHYEKLFSQIESQLSRSIDNLTFKLEAYFNSLEAEGLTRTTATQSSYPLPSGKLVRKKQQPTYDRDDSVLIPWLEQNAPEFVKVKKETDWAGLKKTLAVDGNQMVTEDAEIVPGITVTPRADIFKPEVK